MCLLMEQGFRLKHLAVELGFTALVYCTSGFLIVY